VSPVRYELGFYIPEYGILHSYRRENLKSYTGNFGSFMQETGRQLLVNLGERKTYR
jgi:hypothetical protein